MTSGSVPVCRTTTAANREAYLLLGMLIDRTGMRRAGFLARLAELGYEVSDDALTNWGRPGRSFPRDWPLLRALLAVVSDPSLERRCTVAEGLRFLALTELPFTELGSLANIFPVDELVAALMCYLPLSVADEYLAIGASAAPSASLATPSAKGNRTLGAQS